LRFLSPRWAARASRPPNAELHGDPVNEPAGAAEQARDLLIVQSRVRDDDISDRRMRCRRARFLYDSDAHDLSSCPLDFGVLTHDSSLIRGIAYLFCKFTGDLSDQETSSTLGN